MKPTTGFYLCDVEERKLEGDQGSSILGKASVDGLSGCYLQVCVGRRKQCTKNKKQKSLV